MSFSDQSLSHFAADLASKSPTPGGGGASAMVGALGAALASMVGNLTTGKKKYAQYEEDIQRILKDAQELRLALLDCIAEDAACFEPFSKVYGLPKDDPTREKLMEEALRLACTAPLHIMELAARAIDLHAELAVKGSSLMLSDVGVGVLCCKTALLGASLNVYMNAGLMQDRSYAQNLLSQTEGLIKKHSNLADETYNKILEIIVR